MKGLDDNVYLTLYIIANVVAILLLIATWKAPRLGRLAFFLLFAWASWANWSTAIKTPQAYLDYADLSFLEIYRQFINGWFSNHIRIAVGFIGTCQAMIAISMLLKGWIFKLGALGGIIFLIAIAPFGVGSGFPCTLIMAAALFLLIQKPVNKYLWQRDKAFAWQ